MSLSCFVKISRNSEIYESLTVTIIEKPKHKFMMNTPVDRKHAETPKYNSNHLEGFADLESKGTPVKAGSGGQPIASRISIENPMEIEKETLKAPKIKLTNDGSYTARAPPQVMENFTTHSRQKSLNKVNVMESMEIFGHVDEEVTNERRRVPPRETPKARVKFDSSRQEIISKQHQPHPIAVYRDKKEPDNDPDTATPTPLIPSERKRNEKDNKKPKRPTKVQSTNNLHMNLNDDDSEDSVGREADVTLQVDDSPLTPAMSVLNNAELFKNKDMNRLNSPRAKVETTTKSFVKDYQGKDKVTKHKFLKFEKHKSQRNVYGSNFLSFEPYPNYLGYYFRECFRSTLKDLREQEGNKLKQYSSCDSSEDEDCLPKMSKKLVDDNKTHVTQSMQGLHYVCYVNSTDAYKSQKKRLPPTTKSKLAIFDMDETLIH